MKIYRTLALYFILAATSFAAVALGPYATEDWVEERITSTTNGLVTKEYADSTFSTKNELEESNERVVGVVSNYLADAITEDMVADIIRGGDYFAEYVTTNELETFENSFSNSIVSSVVGLVDEITDSKGFVTYTAITGVVEEVIASTPLNETDPVFTNWLATTNVVIDENVGTFVSNVVPAWALVPVPPTSSETDPVFTAWEGSNLYVRTVHSGPVVLQNTLVVGTAEVGQNVETAIAEGSSKVYANNSHAEGSGTRTASNAVFSHVEGMGSKTGGQYSHASGYRALTAEGGGAGGADAVNPHDYAWAWNGDYTIGDHAWYASHGPGTFNVNPKGGLDGFYIGTNKLSDLLAGGGISSEHDPIFKSWADDNTNSLLKTEVDPSFSAWESLGLYVNPNTDVVVIGNGACADDDPATAVGKDAKTHGSNTLAVGNNVTASNQFAVAVGVYDTKAIAEYSTAVGPYNTASGYSSTAVGMWATASDDYSTSVGYHVTSHGPGTFNINPTGGAAGVWIGETNLATYLAGGESTASDRLCNDNVTLVLGTNGVVTVIPNYYISSDAQMGNIYTKIVLDVPAEEIEQHQGDIGTTMTLLRNKTEDLADCYGYIRSNTLYITNTVAHAPGTDIPPIANKYGVNTIGLSGSTVGFDLTNSGEVFASFWITPVKTLATEDSCVSSLNGNRGTVYAALIGTDSTLSMSNTNAAGILVATITFSQGNNGLNVYEDGDQPAPPTPAIPVKHDIRIPANLSEYINDAGFISSDVIAPGWRQGSYTNGDFVIYNTHLYECTNMTSGVWAPDDWKQTSVTEILGNLRKILDEINGEDL